MKIDEIEVGKEYALTQRSGDPRRVQVMEIVTTKERVWSEVLEDWKPRNVRKVKVKHLDSLTNRGRFYNAPAKGATEVVEHRRLPALWKDIGPRIRARIETEARETALQAETEKRMKKLLGRSYDGYVTVGHRGANLDVYGKSLTKLLDLAEAGKEAQGA